jgi:hypothetical protein
VADALVWRVAHALQKVTGKFGAGNIADLDQHVAQIDIGANR